MSEEKKLIIDDDWKEEAKREKEKLAEKQKETKAEAGGRGPLPEASFQGLVSMLTTQAYLALGLLRMQGEEDRPPDLEMAKYNIDLLGLLEEKTKGNLEEEDVKLIGEALSNLRMAFVQITKGVQSS